MNRITKISFSILAFVFLVAFSSAGATNNEYSGPKQLQPRLSGDGKTIYNGIPAVVYRADPIPPSKQVYIPARVNQPNITGPRQKATFSINYVANGGTDLWGANCTTFPEEAKGAFNAAAYVWGSLLQSNVPITINVCWSDTLSPGILGYAGGGDISCFVLDGTAPRQNTCYAAALANRFVGYDISPDSYDMHITYNSSLPWYYNTSFQTPSGQYDFMTVALHEIAYGLNFGGSMNVAAGLGSWGYPVGPNIYDTFMKDTANDPANLLIDTNTYPNPSAELAAALTSNSVWFSGTNAVAANGGQKAKIYAPSPWQAGFSYSHLDYDTFAGTINGLMVYALPSGISIHDPGPVALGMLNDMGWGWAGAPPPPPATNADLSLKMNTPNKITVGQAATYVITVTSKGPDDALNATIVSRLGCAGTSCMALPKISSVNATSSQGSCSVPSIPSPSIFVEFACNLGTISNGASATITLDIVAATTGSGGSQWLLDETFVYSDIHDPNPGFNDIEKNLPVVNPAPAANSLKPASAHKGGAGFTLTVNGSNFVDDSQVQWNGASRATTFVSSDQLTAQILNSDLAATGTAAVTIFNPAPEGGTSNAAALTISDPPLADGGGGSSGCFIATAAFGSPMERHVQILRDFRDRVLLNSAAGKTFVQFYYRTSPPVADAIAQSEGLKLITRVILMPVIGVAYLMMHLGMTMTLFLLVAIAFTGILPIFIWRRRTGKITGAKAAV